MMAASKKMLDQEPSEIEMLLPCHAAGTLNARDARRVEEALARDPDLARQYAVIREEYAETITSTRAWVRRPRAPCRSCSRRSTESPCASHRCRQPVRADLGIFRKPFAAYAGLVGEPRRRGAAAAGRRDRRRADEEPDRFVPDRLAQHERAAAAPITRDLERAAPPRALVRFAPDARIADITALLDNYQASIVDGAKGGMFRLQFGNKAMGKDEVASLMTGCSARRSSALRWQRRKPLPRARKAEVHGS